MVTRQYLAVAIVALAFTELMLLPGSAAEAGNAAGALNVGDRTVRLTTAYAREEREIPELNVGDPDPHIVVILVDHALPEAATRSELALVQLASTGDVAGLVVDIDPTNGNIFAGKSFLPQGGNPQFFFQTPGSNSFTSDNFKFAAGHASGHVRTSQPVDATNPDGTTWGSYSFDATFDAAVVPAPALLAALTGDRARASDPARAIRRYLEALARGDLAAIKASLASDHPLAAMVTADNLPQLKQEVLGPYADAAGMMANLQKVYLYQAQAELFFKGTAGGTVLPMVLEGGAWKISTP